MERSNNRGSLLLKFNIVILLFSLLLLSVPSVAASSGGLTFDNTTFWASIFNGTTYFDADSADITIIHPNGSVFVQNDSMDLFSLGVFKYENIPQINGNYYVSVDFAKNNTFILTADDTLYVVESVNQMLVNITILLILLTIGLGFAWFAERSENFVWYVFGGVWFLVIAPLSVNLLLAVDILFAFLSIAFFWLIAFVMIYEAVDRSLSESNNEEDE